MIYRQHGKTGVELSIVGFGGMRFKNIDNRDECVEMVVRAAELGINYFDTAPKYFGIKSELTYGEAFKILKKRGIKFYSSTKTFESKEYKIRKELDAQLKRLNLDYIDFYHIWSVVTLKNWEKRKRDGVVETFVKLKDEGLIKHIAVSSHLIGDEIKELLDEGIFEAVLIGYSAYNFSTREKAFEAIKKHNIGCVVMNPLGGGIIPRHPELFESIKTYKEQSVVEAALHFLFAHEKITTALVGFSTLKEVEEAVRAVESFKSVDRKKLETMKQSITGAFEGLCTGCHYCNNCPERIPIPQFMEAYNHKILYGDDKKILDRLKWHWDVSKELAAKCTECGRCEAVCTQHIPIIERLKEISEL